MWRNFGWAAILATWTILLILNSGLAGERASNNPRINNERTSRAEAHRAAKFHAPDRRAADDFTLRHAARGSRKSSDRASMRNIGPTVSLEFKNTENRDSRVGGHEKRVATSGGAPAYNNDDGNAVRLTITTGRIMTGSARLSRIIRAERSARDTGNYRKFVSKSHHRESRGGSRKRRRRERMTRAVSSHPRERTTTTTRRDVRDTYDDTRRHERKQHRSGRIFGRRRSGTTAFSRDGFVVKYHPHDGWDSSARKLENSAIPKFISALAKNEKRRVRNGNREDSRRSLHELAGGENGANKLIHVQDHNNGSRTSSSTSFSKYSSPKETRRNSATVVTDAAVADSSSSRIAVNTPHERFVTVDRTTVPGLIRGSGLSGENERAFDDEENALSLPSKDERGESYKAAESPAAETYKRDDAESSKAGFKTSTMDAREENKGRNEDIESPFTFRAADPLDNHPAGNGVSFTAERPLAREKRNALRRTSDTTDAQHGYRPLISNIGARMESGDGETMNPGDRMRARERRQREKENIAESRDRHAMRDPPGSERDPSSISSFTEGIDESRSSRPTSARIPVTPDGNLMHVRRVGSYADRERPRTAEYASAGIRDASRIGLRNVSDSSRIAKLGGELPFEIGRARHSRRFAGIDAGMMSARRPLCIARLVNGKSGDPGGLRREISTGDESISFAATTASIADSSSETWKINGHAPAPAAESEDMAGLRNAGATAPDRSGNHRDVTGSSWRDESGFRSRDSKIREWRRYKRSREVWDTSASSVSIASINSETQDTFDTGMMTTETSASVATPSVSTARASSTEETFASAGEPLAIIETLPSSRYPEPREEGRSILRITTDQYIPDARADSVSPEVPLADAPRKPSSMGTVAFLINTLDRSTTITDVDGPAIERGTIASTQIATDTDVADVTTSETPLRSVPSIVSISSPGGRETFPSEWSKASTVDPPPQMYDLPRPVPENVTAGNVDDSSAPLDQWPVKHSAVVEGDLVLGGLMMVHEREDTVTCGPVMPQGGVQALEAMLYTLDMLNDREIVPGVKIGAHILDDCDKDTYGLEMAVDFIKGSISNIDGAEYHCNKTAVRKVISGVVGAASSVTSIQVANLLRLFRIPQVSFFSTSPELSNKQRFEYFTRTIPSDHYQVKAMVDIVLTMGWSYVSIIHEESNYGIKAFEELEELLGKYNICIAVKEKLVKDSGVAEEIAYDNIVLKLLTKPRARGCIIFGSDQEVAGVMRAVRRCNATGAFSWIGSDGWSARGLVSNGNEPEVEGTLSVQPQANPVKGFEKYFLNLTVENNRRNPWFVEFWEDHFKCRYPNSSRTPYNTKYTKVCTTKERLTKQNTAFEDQLQFVSDAVMAFAYAFRDMHRHLCHGKAGLCDAMKPTKGTTLLQYLRKVDFEGLSGDKFRFDKNGDGPARYNIIHFKQIKSGRYKWVRVGKYLEGELRLNMSEIQFKLGHPQPPESVCSLPCELGQAKKYVEGERCCWHCFNCTQYQIRHPKDETQCIQCRRGTLPDETHSTCREVPEEFLRPESVWAIGAMSFSATGILVMLFVCGVFLRHNDTPVVRASGRELSYVLLLGILFCYLVTFTLVLKPTDVVCGIQRFAAGFCFTVVYAALLTKTNRISRIFNAGSAKRPSLISPRSQLIICGGLIFVQIVINVTWMLIDPARAMHHYPSMEDNLLVCNNYVDASYLIAFAYPTILIVVCTVYAVLTRKIPEAFNESKHIGLTMYTTCVIWFAFVPLYYSTGNNVALRITSMSVTISLSASVTVICLFSPKLYIILIRPERNVRPTVRAGRPNLTRSSAITATNASSMMGPVTATTVLTAATCDQNKAIKKHIASTMDCSTQSECYELELKDQKNGKPPATCTTRSTQTTINEELVTVMMNNKESPDVIASASNKESKNSTTITTTATTTTMTTTTTSTPTMKRLNSNARIGNGPLSQSDVSL